MPSKPIGRKRRSAAGARSLAGCFFTSEEVFDRESEQIFWKEWIYLGHSSELPDQGNFFVREIRGENLFVLRDEGSLRAFHNVCRHRGTRLCEKAEGTLEKRVRCPYHAWAYALDGRLMAAPGMHDVKGFDPGEWSLRPIHLSVWNGLVFVNLDQEPPPIDRTLKALARRCQPWRLPELTSVHRTVYEVEANWKLFFQNYNECYHCPGVHPHLNRLTPYRDSTNDLDSGRALGGPMRLTAGAGSMTTSGRRCAPLIAPGEQGLDDQVYYYTVFPNLFLSLHPDYVLIHRSESIGPAETRIFCDWLFAPEAVSQRDFDPQEAIDFWDLTNRQDWDLCRRAQLGVSTRGYLPGPYSDLESQLAAFDREYLRILDGTE